MIAEILPLNETTKEIMAQREAIEAQRRIELEEVYIIILHIITHTTILI